MPNQAEIDRLARELYVRGQRCPHQPCFAEISWADLLKGRCPRCNQILLAGPDITPEKGREMLVVLQARRKELGLSP